MKHLRFDMRGAYEAGKHAHPQKTMKDLGITYQHATPQSIADCWIFWNCDNIPETLPSYIEEAEIDPMDFVGFGLSEEMATSIKNKGII